jgi:hypothetical protein
MYGNVFISFFCIIKTAKSAAAAQNGVLMRMNGCFKFGCNMLCFRFDEVKGYTDNLVCFHKSCGFTKHPVFCF